MKQEVKEKWVAALRSGQYNQGRRFLKQDESGNETFCCLGVLCDISGQGEWLNTGTDTFDFAAKGDRSFSILPTSIAKWAGLDDENPDINDHGVHTCLAALNDAGRDFTYIAKLIEEQL